MRIGTAYSIADVAHTLRVHTELHIVLALQQVQTVDGAMRIYVAEHQGLHRRRVLQAADRRIAQLRGEEAPFTPRLELGACAVDAEQRAWEHQRGSMTT